MKSKKLTLFIFVFLLLQSCSKNEEEEIENNSIKLSTYNIEVIAGAETSIDVLQESKTNSGRDNYIKNGGALGRSKGSIKTTEQKKLNIPKLLVY